MFAFVSNKTHFAYCSEPSPTMHIGFHDYGIPSSYLHVDPIEERQYTIQRVIVVGESDNEVSGFLDHLNKITGTVLDESFLSLASKAWRINIIVIDTYAVSLYNEGKRVITYPHATSETMVIRWGMGELESAMDKVVKDGICSSDDIPVELRDYVWTIQSFLTGPEEFDQWTKDGNSYMLIRLERLRKGDHFSLPTGDIHGYVTDVELVFLGNALSPLGVTHIPAPTKRITFLLRDGKTKGYILPEQREIYIMKPGNSEINSCGKLGHFVTIRKM